MKVAVVGAGIVGLSAARFLAKRGHSVTLFEQFPVGHDRGSSHGESRIVRRAYPDAFYTACMAEAYPMWRELERESDRKLLTECGLLYFGSSTSQSLREVLAGLQDLGVDHRVMTDANVRDAMPRLQLGEGEIAIHTPEAGWVHADHAMAATYDLAIAAGTTLRQERAEPLELAKTHDAVVVAAGAWIRRYTQIPLEVRRMTFGYLQTPSPGPVWIEEGPNYLYGFPQTEWGTKIGVHYPGTVIEPDDPDRTPDPAALELIRDFGRRRFGVDVPVDHAKACLYTVAPNEDFRLGRLAPNVFFASACSGHGFKFGPWIGRLLADFVDGRDTPENHPRFAATGTAGLQTGGD